MNKCDYSRIHTDLPAKRTNRKWLGHGLKGEILCEMDQKYIETFE